MAPKKEKRKILMVNQGFFPEAVGGTEIYTHHLSRALIEQGHQVTIVAALDSLTLKRYKKVECHFEGIKVIRIVNSPNFARSFNDYFVDPQVDGLFSEIIEREAPDVIHFQHLANLSGSLPEIAYKLRIPTIITLHDYWYLCFRSRLVRPGFGICPGPSEGLHCASCDDPLVFNPTAVPKSSVMLRMMLRCRRYIPNGIVRSLPQSLLSQIFLWFYGKRGIDRRNAKDLQEQAIIENKFRFSFFKRQLSFPQFLLSPSFYLKKRYDDEGYNKILVLPLGFPKVTKPDSLPVRGKLKIAFIGNIERDKGVAVILKELLHFQPLGKIEINIHGRPKDKLYYAEVERLAKKYPDGIVKLHGAYRSDKDLTLILSEVHVLVFPSLWEENYPLVVREALLNGVPVIASKYGGVVEVIEDGKNGLLFDPYREGDLADKINSVISKPDTLELMRQGARKTKVETMEDHVLKLTELYSRALTNSQPNNRMTSKNWISHAEAFKD